MTAKLLAGFVLCFNDKFVAVCAEACTTASRLRLRDNRVISGLSRLIGDELIHCVKALAVQGLSAL